jgi:hypothetical protein
LRFDAAFDATPDIYIAASHFRHFAIEPFHFFAIDCHAEITTPMLFHFHAAIFRYRSHFFRYFDIFTLHFIFAFSDLPFLLSPLLPLRHFSSFGFCHY